MKKILGLATAAMLVASLPLTTAAAATRPMNAVPTTAAATAAIQDMDDDDDDAGLQSQDYFLITMGLIVGIVLIYEAFIDEDEELGVIPPLSIG